jgi:hypothetical protein
MHFVAYSDLRAASLRPNGCELAQGLFAANEFDCFPPGPIKFFAGPQVLLGDDENEP